MYRHLPFTKHFVFLSAFLSVSIKNWGNHISSFLAWAIIGLQKSSSPWLITFNPQIPFLLHSYRRQSLFKACSSIYVFMYNIDFFICILYFHKWAYVDFLLSVIFFRFIRGNFLGSPVVKTPSSQCRQQASLKSGQGTRPHMPQLRACM